MNEDIETIEAHEMLIMPRAEALAKMSENQWDRDSARNHEIKQRILARAQSLTGDFILFDPLSDHEGFMISGASPEELAKEARDSLDI